MTSSTAIIFKLVRMAIGWETDFSLPEDVDWQEVLIIAQEQGVNAIVIDGLEVYMSKLPQDSSIRQSDKFKQVLFEAIGGLHMIELNYSSHLEALIKLSNILSKKDISFMVMKGFACGQYYPKPKHRICGDIDIYPGEHFDESNQALKEAGVEVDPYYYRHSASYLNDVMIENHKVLGDLRGYKKESREFERWLKREAGKSLKDGNDLVLEGMKIAGAKCPMTNFNVLFLPWHVSAHFAFERVTLRHLLDWALFLTNEGQHTDVCLFCEAKERFSHGYRKMVDIMTNLSLRYLSMPMTGIPNEIIEEAYAFDAGIADRVLDYMFTGQPRERDKNIWIVRWNNIKRMWQDRWKYKEIYNMSLLAFLYQRVIGVVFKVGE